jgi:toxin ParE1/3/4
MYKVELTSDASNDINQIIVFIFLESKERAIALSYLDILEESILSLEKFPERGSNPRYKVLRNQGYKFLVVKSHIIFYKVNQEHKIVTIYRVLHNKSAYQNFL